MKYLYFYLLIVNALSFLFMLTDKIKAIKGRWRIRERTLLTLCAIGGSLGGMLFVTCIGTGLAGGMFYGIGANYVFKIVDHRAASTAMAVLGLTKSLVAMLGSGVGGQIIDRFGVLTLTTAVGFISLGFTVLFGLTCALGRFVLKIPYVSERQSV